jgi:DNA-binding beta-propeller fold protein YncE
VVANAGLGASVSLVDTTSVTVTQGANRCGVTSHVQTDSSGSKIYALSSHRDKLLVLSAVDGSVIQGFVVGRGLCHEIAPDPGPKVLLLVPTPQGDLLVFAGQEGDVIVWDVTTDTLVTRINVGDEVTDLDLDEGSGVVLITVGGHVVAIDPDFIATFGMRMDPPSVQQVLTPVNVPVPCDTCVGDVVVLVDDGLNDLNTSLVLNGETSAVGEQVFCSVTGTILERFYATMPDVFDYVIVFFSSEWRDLMDAGLPINVEPEAGNAYHYLVRNHTRGIGGELEPGKRFGNRAGTVGLTTQRLQSVIHMNDLAEYDTNHIGFGNRNVVHILAQELGHRFLAYTELETPTGDILKRDGSHWHPAFDSQGSVMGGVAGNDLTALGGGDFLVAGKEYAYSDWDRYLMGLLDLSQVSDSFRVDGAAPVNPLHPEPYQAGDVIQGTEVAVPIAELVATYNNRIPSQELSQRVFHVGVCLVTPTANVRQQDLDEIGSLMGLVQDFFHDQTGAHLTTRVAPDIYTSLGPSVQDMAGSSDQTFVQPGRMAMSPDGAKLFVPERGQDRVGVVDTDPDSPTVDQVLYFVDVGNEPMAAAVRGDGSRVYATSFSDQTLSVIDPSIDPVANPGLNPVVNTIAVGPGSVALAVGLRGPAADRGYVLNAGDNTITEVDLTTETVLSVISTGDQDDDLEQLFAVGGAPDLFNPFQFNLRASELDPATVVLLQDTVDSNMFGKATARCMASTRNEDEFFTHHAFNGIMLPRSFSVHDPDVLGSGINSCNADVTVDALSFAFLSPPPDGGLYAFDNLANLYSVNLLNCSATLTLLGSTGLTGVFAADSDPTDPLRRLYVVHGPSGGVKSLARFNSPSASDFITVALLNFGGVVPFTGPIGSIAFDRQGNLVAASGNVLYDLNKLTGELTQQRTSPDASLVINGMGFVINPCYGDVAVSPDGEVLVYSNPGDGTVTARHVLNGNPITLASGAGASGLAIVQQESNVHNTVARALASTSPPALVYVSNCRDNTIRVFDLTTDPATGTFQFRRLTQDPDDPVSPVVPDLAAITPHRLAFAPGGNVAVVSGRNAVLTRVIAASHGQYFNDSFTAGSSAVFSPDGERLYVAGDTFDNGPVRIFR